MRKLLIVLAAAFCVLAVCAAERCEEAQYWDHSVDECPALPGETDDQPRLQRAVYACANKVLFVPAGDYKFDRTLVVTNYCSVLMHKRARFIAEKPMEYVVKVNFSPLYKPVFKPWEIMDFGNFFKGGRIDGRGIASCMSIHGYFHFTLRDVCFHNGKVFGLRVKGDAGPGGCELNASNLHFVNKVKGNAGNTAIKVTGCDDNFTDCWAMDYTVGFDIEGSSNFLTRCHAYGGVVPAPAPGEMPEYLKDSIGFRIRHSSNVLLRDCYSDTASTGYLVEGWEVRILGCCYFYNGGMIKKVKPENRDKFVVFKQPVGTMLVADGLVVKNLKDTVIYEGNGNARFRDIVYCGKGLVNGENRPGECVFKTETVREVKLLD